MILILIVSNSLGRSDVEDNAKKQVCSTRSITLSNSSTSRVRSDVDRTKVESLGLMGHC